MKTLITYILTTLISLQSTTNAFLSLSLRSTYAKKSNIILHEGRIERIEFKIFPDGRIEETVKGIKGGKCHEVTKEINESLGKVVDSKPTEEMFEQEIEIDQTISVKNGEDNSGGWDGASSW